MSKSSNKIAKHIEKNVIRSKWAQLGFKQVPLPCPTPAGTPARITMVKDDTTRTFLTWAEARQAASKQSQKDQQAKNPA